MEIAERWYGRIFIAVTGLLVMGALAGRQLSPSVALVVLAAGVVLLGLPHGALDPMVARKAFAGRHAYTNLGFYAGYLALVLGYWLLWNRYPTLGLALFLVIAAFHFGSDWEPRGSVFTRCAYGLTVVTLPTLRNPSEVASIYTMLGTGHAEVLVTVSRVMAPFAVVIATVGSVLHFRQRRSDAVELVTIVAGALWLNPLVFFTCYFALLHSPLHLLETAGGIGITSLKRIYRATLPVVLATLLLAALAYCLLPRIGMEARFLRIVFIGLAALTVPHMLLNTAVNAEIKRHPAFIPTANSTAENRLARRWYRSS
jgi:Brp/Blh family beta-carotene 15,15'-monooxygenase